MCMLYYLQCTEVSENNYEIFMISHELNILLVWCWMSLKGRGFKLKWHGSYISLNNDIHRGRSSDISRFKVLHKTSISSFKFNFRSGSAWSSARRFIRPWVQGHGGLNTLLLNADSSTLVTASLSILLL